MSTAQMTPREALKHANLDYIERFVAIFEMLLGIGLLCIPRMLTIPTYSLILRLLPQWSWGLIFVCLGGLRLLTVLRSLNIRWRIAYSMFAALIWGLFAISILQSVGPVMSSVVYALLSGKNAALYILRGSALVKRGDNVS